ncbi:MAG: T9SS type A sorting domain-containing protein [Saprospiraceae bacterium]|nr:T9SS type A sorting domain-containing protein [Saprospiraceae bacterium]MBP7698999.1 T9SS type A sorting domain-containing protein [Saprospiraceae bacterium]
MNCHYRLIRQLIMQLFVCCLLTQTLQAQCLNVNCTAFPSQGGNGGAIVVDVTATPNATFPLSVLCSNGFFTSLNNVPATTTIQVGNGGTYMITVTDATNACSATCSSTVSNSGGATVTGQVTPNTDCQGQWNGAIDITVTPADNYTYLWNNGSVTEDQINLSPGAYSVSVVNSSNIVVAASNFFVENIAFEISCSFSTVSASGASDGSISVISIFPSVGPFNGTINGVSVFIPALPHTFTNLAEGTYEIILADPTNNNCTSQCTANVTASPNFEVVGQVTNATCGQANGSINVTPIPFGTYYYVWSNGTTTEDQLNLSGGTYFVTVTDMNNVTSTAAFTVTNTLPPSQIAIATTPLDCFGQFQLISSVPGTIGGPFTYNWSGPCNFTSTASNPVVSNFCPGTYCLVVTDMNGCSETSCITITQLQLPVLQANCSSTNVTTVGGSDGSIFVSIAGGQNPPSSGYEIIWGGPTSGSMFSTNPFATITNLSAGAYSITVTSVNTGCAAYCTSIVNNPACNFVVVPTIEYASCSDLGSITLSVSEGTPPFSYNWTPNGWTGPVIPEAAAGTYSVTITDAIGCSQLFTYTVWDSVQVFLQCYSVNNGVNVEAFGGTTPYTFNWSNGATTQAQTDLPSGAYTVTVLDAAGCSATCTTQFQSNRSQIVGKVYNDTNDDCSLSVGETGNAGWRVRAAKGTDVRYALANSSGSYIIHTDTGTYELMLLPPLNNNFWQYCQSSYFVNSSPIGDLDTLDIPYQAIVDCPLMTVDISVPFLRRCNTNYYNVYYCNNGTVVATGAHIDVTLDAVYSITGSTQTYTNLGNNVYRFNIGTVDVGTCGSFSFNAFINCSAVLSSTHCAEAHIFPDTACVFNPLWSGASVQLTTNCTDSIHFTLKNVGTGDMAAEKNYFVIEDDVMYIFDSFQLDAGDSISVAVPANGSTYRMIAEQEEYHPGNNSPTIAIEGWGTNGAGGFSTGFMNMFSPNDADPYLDIDCKPIIGSYDPNEKLASPTGYREEHYIEPNTDIEYQINFQNTGNDTAFLVVVRDTLSNLVNVETVYPSVSSHPYRFSIDSSNILVFTFENILLPDSFVNEAASHGYVKYRISQKAENAIGEVIKNSAAIYFDGNDPVITNETYHIIGRDFVEVVSTHDVVNTLAYRAYPNPFSESVHFELPVNTNAYSFYLYNANGVLIQQFTAADNQFDIPRKRLLSGIYFFRILDMQGRIATGKLIAK